MSRQRGLSRSEWAVEQRYGTAGQLHASWERTRSAANSRAVAICHVDAPAVVLGSTQASEVIDAVRARQAGIDIARRRSGGGAVLVAPGDPVWVDAWVPRGDLWWHDDVARAFDWIGDAWTEALRSIGCDRLTTRREGLSAASRWSSLVCFGGVGTGEVVSEGGRKVVGISQRRTREGAWFHSACVLSWEPGPLLDVLDLPEQERIAARTELEAVAGGVRDHCHRASVGDVDATLVLAAILAALP